MAKEMLAQVGHMVHVYDFRVQPGMGDEFVRRFHKIDQSGTNPFHQSPAQVKDGVLCRDDSDPDHFYLLGEWTSKEAHQAIFKQRFGGSVIAEHMQLVIGQKITPIYTTVVA